MDTLAQLAQGFAIALTPINLMWCFVGVTVGTAIGVLPGIGPALTIALLLPLTYKVDATAAFILFAGIYYGAMYGGSTTSILLNTPGESATIVTAMEGQEGSCGRGPGNGCHWLLCGRHDRHHRAYLCRRARRPVCLEIRAR
jgi:putative tricarboxylic transport membrane protein